MPPIFYGLLDNAIAEVSRREPAYPSLFPIAVSEEMVSGYRGHPLTDQLPKGAVEQALADGLAYVTRRWTKAEQAGTSADPVAQVLCDCIVDACCADQGLFPLQPYNRLGWPVTDALAQYSHRQTPDGVSYYVRDGGSRPLLLINATGAPALIWTEFLGDPAHDFKIILPERRGSDLLRGGVQQYVDISTDSSDLASILDAEQLEQADVLAWCNGARVAIDLANCRSHQIASLVLLGPMLKGVQGVSPCPSNFERDLQPLLDAVGNDPSLAPFLVQVIVSQPESPDWARWTHAPVSRAQALFAMPAKEQSGAMIAMLTDPQSLINIARRVASDESYPMKEALGTLQARTMVIMGSDDSIVSNQLVLSAMKQICRNSISTIVVKGSGHYIQDLQYHYFRWLLTEFLENRRAPQGTARVRVENSCCYHYAGQQS